MLTGKERRSTGVACVIPATERKLGRKWEESRPCRDPDTRNIRSVSCVGSGHRNNLNWMCSLWMGV
jgi:hypothetical protein